MSLKDRLGSSRKKKQLFGRYRMWIYYLLSRMYKDVNSIPPNIGNRLLLTNNVYVTSKYISSMTQVVDIGSNAPILFLEEVLRDIRKESKCVMDFSIKNQEYYVNLADKGLETRIAMWESSLNKNFIPDRTKVKNARCLATVDAVRLGERLYKSRIYITLRATTSRELEKGEKALHKSLTRLGAIYDPVSNDIKKILRFTSMISDEKFKELKDIPISVQSDNTLAKLLPNTATYEKKKGVVLGTNILNNSIYKLDFREITKARNIIILAPSGEGKTVTAITALDSAMEEGYAASVMDLKGNELSATVLAAGGYKVSLRSTATEYINSFRLVASEAVNRQAYINEMFSFSKKTLKIFSGVIKKEDQNELELFVDDFMDFMYTSIGFLRDNVNTWKYTDKLNPRTVYVYLEDYLSSRKADGYNLDVKSILNSYKLYFSERGSYAYAMTDTFRLDDILKAKAIVYDFGGLNNTSSIDEDDASRDMHLMFRYKLLIMSKLNADFAAYKYSQGIPVFKILEEAQHASDDILQIYVKEYTLRRAQQQTTMMLANATSALVSNPIARPLIDNITALLIGCLPNTAMETIITEFNLDAYRPLLEKVGTTEEFVNSFVFVNRMEPTKSKPVLKVILEKHRKYKIYTPEV